MVQNKIKIVHKVRLLFVVFGMLLGGCVPLGPDPIPVASDYCLVKGTTSRPIWFAGQAPTYEQIAWLPDNETIIIKNKVEKIYLVNLNEGSEPMIESTEFRGWFSYSPAMDVIAVVEARTNGTMVTQVYKFWAGELLAKIAYISAVGEQLYLYTIDPTGENKRQVLAIPQDSDFKDTGASSSVGGRLR